MNKELSPLESLKKLSGLARDKYSNVEVEPLFNIIESALKRLEKIDNILPMEIRDTDDLQSMVNHYLGADYQKLKALEIIKEKNVNVGDFKRCKSLEDYNDYCCYSEKEQLTQEEYDLLKEVLL